MKGFLCVQVARASEAKQAFPAAFFQTEMLTLQGFPSFKKREIDARVSILHNSHLLSSPTVLGMEKQTLNPSHVLSWLQLGQS